MNVIYEIKNRVGYITMNRAEKRNALNAEFVTEITDNFLKAFADENCKIIVLKSSSDVFCAGADLEYLQQLQKNSYEENLADSKHLAKLFKTIYSGEKLVVAQVEGAAIAGGCGLANVCDITFATPAAKFGYSEVKIGFIPAIVMIFLIRKCGESVARNMMLTGKIFDADEAKNAGLVHYIYNKNDIAKNITDFAEKLCSETSTQSIKLTKKMMSEVQHLSIDDAILFAADNNANARSTDDCKRGIAAFLNKEKLVW